MKTKLLIAVFCSVPPFLPAAETNTLTPAESAAGWHLLFDGNSLAGWQANEAPATFHVADGAIVVKGPRSHLFYTGPVANHDFKNFELTIDVLTRPGANSGVYFHTELQPEGWPAKGYEVQVNNTQKDIKRTAGLYGIKDNFDTVAKDDVWFTMKIKVEGQVWDITLAPSPRTAAAGLKADTLPVGAQVTIRGHRSLDAKKFEVKTERVTYNGKLYDVYPGRD